MAASKEHPGIPLAKPSVSDEDVRAVTEVLRSGQLALGPRTAAFEAALAEYVGVRHAVAVNSGTSALHLLIRALGIGPGDEVITTPFSFIASANCILFERALPVFVDIEPSTLCIDPSRIEDAVTYRTKAILAVDVFGHPADWPAIGAIAERHDLQVIEDAAEALGSELDGRRCGAHGDAAVFGFYPNKQITTGEGGALVTDDSVLAEQCRSMADQGRGVDGWLSHVRLGYNYRIDEMSAALGASQMARIESLIAKRARVAMWYQEALQPVDGVRPPEVRPNVRMSWFVYVVQLEDRMTRSGRDRVLKQLRDEGIGCRDYFQPIHLQPFIQETLGTKRGQFPITEAVGDRTVALPFFPEMTREQVERVCAVLARAIAREA